MLDNVNKYIIVVNTILSMYEKGIISEAELKKSESFIAKKHCIKPNSIFRVNDLIKNRLRVINGVDGKD